MANFTINSLSTGTLNNNDNFLTSDSSGALTKVAFSDIKQDIVSETITPEKIVNNFTTTESGYVADARTVASLNVTTQNLSASVTSINNSFLVEANTLTGAKSDINIGTVNMANKYGRIVFVSIVFSISSAAAENEALFTTPYPMRFPIIIPIRKDLGSTYLIGSLNENGINIRALYGEGLPAGTYRGSFVYLTN